MAEGYYKLGKKPKKMNDVGMPDKVMNPSMNIDAEQYPPLKDMKLGSTGEACIQFKINPKYGGIEVIAMKPLKSSDKIDGKGGK